MGSLRRPNYHTPGRRKKKRYCDFDDGHGYYGTGYSNFGEYNEEGHLKRENAKVFSMKTGVPNAIRDPNAKRKSKKKKIDMSDPRARYYHFQIEPKIKAQKEAEKAQREPTEYEKATAGMTNWQKAQYNKEIARKRKKKEEEQFHKLLHEDEPIPEFTKVQCYRPEGSPGYDCISFDAPKAGIEPIKFMDRSLMSSKKYIENNPYFDQPFYHWGKEVEDAANPFKFKTIDQ